MVSRRVRCLSGPSRASLVTIAAEREPCVIPPRFGDADDRFCLTGRPELAGLWPQQPQSAPVWDVNRCRALAPLPPLMGGARPAVGYHARTRVDIAASALFGTGR